VEKGVAAVDQRDEIAVDRRRGVHDPEGFAAYSAGLEGDPRVFGGGLPDAHALAGGSALRRVLEFESDIVDEGGRTAGGVDARHAAVVLSHRSGDLARPEIVRYQVGGCGEVFPRVRITGPEEYDRRAADLTLV
jgi:hypothetical protein